MKKFTLLGIIAIVLSIVSLQAQNAWINEIHYDNTGTDVDELVEIVIEDVGSYILADFTVSKYNGNGGVVYGSDILTSFTPGDVIGNFSIYHLVYPANGLQNGPDGLCLDYQGTVLLFISYEGTVDATEGPAMGTTSVDIGVSQSGPPIGETLQLSGTGTEYIDFTWMPPATGTPGAVNNGQILDIGGNLPPTISNVIQTPVTVTSSLSVSVSADVTDSDGTIDLVELNWGTSPGSLTNNINMSNTSGDNYTTDSPIPAQANGTTVYYQIYAEDDIGDDNSSSEMSYEVTDPATTTLPYTEPFDADLGECYPFSVTGATKNWTWHSGEYAYMSGYNSGETEEDWLVLPGINMDDYSNEFMTFDTWYQYGTDDVNNYLKLYYSTDYFGVGDPTSATWTELPYNQPAASQVWAPSGYVNLTGITGTMVYIAFKYNYEAGSYRNWGVDNISIDIYEQLDWANLQWPGSGNITVGTTYTVYAQAYEPGVTDLPGQGADLVAWIGYSTTDTDPSTWTDWVLAPYFGEVGSNDEYSLDLGLEILSAGTYYYASRFQLGTNPFQYGGFQGGFWDGVGNVSGVLTVNPPSAQIDWANLQWPPDGTISLGGDFTVYAQVYEPGVTDMPGQGPDITAWIGYSTTDTDPVTWTDWVPATFNTDAGINDEYMANIGTEVLTTGTVFYASRFKLGLADYVYGGYNPGGGGFWDGTTNVSGELTINGPEILINEVDVDQTSIDDQEFIELFDGGTGNTDLSGLVVVFYNGSDDASYLAYDLDGFSTNATGYFVLGNAAVPNVDLIFPDNSLQNGADAVALYIGNADDFPNDTPVTTDNLIDAIVYDTDDGDDSGLLVLLNPGQPQVNEDGNGDKDNHSSQRIPNGSGGARNTDTYDQTPPTPGAENVSVITDWTGAVDSNWDDAGNWTNGVPTAVLDATIPDVGANPYPVIAGSANANNIYVAAAATLTIDPGADLTAAGQVDVDGGFYMSSNATGVSASFIDNGVTGGGTFYFLRDLFCTGSNPGNEADPFGWHYISAPIDGLSTDDLLDYYVNQWDEVGNAWMNFEGTEPCIPYPTEYLDGVEAWSINQDTEYACPDPGAGTLVEYSGSFWSLHTGGFTTPVTASGGSFSGWNMIGNPYPSAIDPAAFNWTGFENGTNGVAIYDGCTGNYIYSSLGNGYAYKVGPTQGFFMLTSGATDFALDGSERVHDNGTTIYKDAVSSLLTIEATGDGTSDLTYIRFMEGSQAGMDKADFPKLISTTEGLAQIYTTIGQEMLAVNALPSTPIVPMGFTSVTTGEYTISANEANDFSHVVLEDLLTGEQIDLLTDSYTFNYTVNDDANRFVVHFTPLGIGDNAAANINIWSGNHNIYVETPEINGDIVVFNMMGQEVTRTQIESGLNVIPVSEVNAFYVVKIIGSEASKTGKVYVK